MVDFKMLLEHYEDEKNPKYREVYRQRLLLELDKAQSSEDVIAYLQDELEFYQKENERLEEHIEKLEEAQRPLTGQEKRWSML